MRKKWRIVILVGASAGAVSAPIQGAGASNWAGASGQTGCTSLNSADNKTHTIYYSSLDSSQATEVDDFRNYLRNNTAVTDQTVSVPDSTTDAVLYDEDYTTYCGYGWDGTFGILGLTTCVSINTAYECEKHEVRFDTSDYSALGSTGREHNACHELGHSLGLTHSGESSSCMMPGQYSVTTYTNHDKAHLSNDLV